MALQLRRGDPTTLDVSGLLAADGTPTIYGPNDILIWTAKTAPDARTALIVKTSADGGVNIQVGSDQATVIIDEADWVSVPVLAMPLPFVWDLQLFVAGDTAQPVTLDIDISGDALVLPDVTGNVEGAPTASGDAGPCTPWGNLGDLLADPTARRAHDGNTLDPALLQEMGDVAGSILYRLSGRQYAGACADVVRPTARWYRYDGSLPRSTVNSIYPRMLDFYTDRNPHRIAGATRLQEITLGAYPLRTVSEVLVDGVVRTEDTYRIDDRRWLVNLDTDSPWPSAQDLSLAPTERNTMQVAFTFGQDAPAAGSRAWKQLTIELAKGASGDRCQLPDRVTSLTMQGVSYAVLDPLAFLDKGRTGLYLVDLFLASVNPKGIKRRAAVLSPDLPRPVRRTDTTPATS